MKIKKAVIPAAGLGTRFLPATKAQPKEMLPIVDKPAIQYIIEEAVASGIEEVLIITGRGKNAIEDHFDRSYELEHTLTSRGMYEIAETLDDISSMINIHYIRQKDPKGLGHAISCAKGFIGDEPFGVLLGDDLVYSPKPCLRQLMEVYEKYNCSVVSVQEVAKEDIFRYGVIKPEYHALHTKNIFSVIDLIEKPSLDKAPSNLGIIGRYILTPEIFEILVNLVPGAGGEIQLTDALRVLNQKQPLMACKCIGKRYDTGNVFGYLQANIEYALRRNDLGQDLQDYLESLLSSPVYKEQY